MSKLRTGRFAVTASALFGTTILAVLSSFGCATVAAQSLELDREIEFAIPAQPLETALLRLSEQSGVQILTASTQVPVTSSRAISGRLSVRAALRELLSGTGLTFSLVRDKTVAIHAPTTSQAPAQSERARQARVDAGGPDAIAADTGSEKVHEVIVTGSRIARQDYISNSPFITVGQSQIEASGATTVETFLNQMPQFVPSNTATTNNDGGGGQASADLRGLRPNRTLVLLDGRRVTPSNADGRVDLNTIPAALIENVEIITGGASSTYGSDAVAGVVNFILKRNFTGLEASAQYGATDREDGATTDADLVWGENFASGRGNVVLAVGYSGRDSIFKAEREFSAVSGASTTLPQGSYDAVGSNLPTQAAVDSVFSQYGLAPGTVLRTAGLSFNPDASLFSGRVNYRGPTSPGYETIPVNGTYNSLATAYLVTPLTRYNAFGRVTYELMSGVELFGQLNYTTYEATTRLGGANVSGNPAAGGSGFLVPVTNPFIPQDLRTILAARPNPDAPFLFRKRFTEAGDRMSENDFDVHQLVVGAKGPLWGEWTWDAHVSQGRTRNDETQSGAVSHEAVRVLLEASDGGSSLCEGGYNAFGENGLSSQCRSFITRRLENSTQYEQRIVEAALQGPIASLPAGELKTALGVSHRKDEFAFKPDPLLSIRDIVVNTANPALSQNAPGLAGSSSLPRLNGSVAVTEAFAEALVPLLRDLPAVEELNLDLGARYSDYDTIGAVYTYKGSLDWSVLPSLRARGGYSRAIRAPSIGELYAPQSRSSPQFGRAGPPGSGDPCDINGAYRRGPDAAAVRALCLEQGVPESLIDSYTYSNTFIAATVGGNPDLEAETADTYSVGLVWMPRFSNPLFSRLSFSVDYYSIEVTDAIGVIGATTTLSNCFNNPQGAPTNPGYSRDNFFCNLIERDPSTGIINNTIDTNTNLGRIDTAGIDFALDWRFGLGAVGLEDRHGSVSLSVAGTYLDKFDIQRVPGSITEHRVESVANTLGSHYASWKTLTSLTYSVGPWSLGGTWRHIGRVDNFVAGGQAAPAYDYFDLITRLDVGEQWQIRIGATNLADKQPPVYAPSFEANTDPSTYDVLGRRFFAAVQFNF